MISLNVNNNSYADQLDPIKKGQAAQYDGVIMDQERANKVANSLLERDLYKELTLSYEKTLNLYKANNEHTNTQNKMLLDQNDKLALQLKEAQGLNTWERIGLIALGVVMTVGAGVAINNATK